MPTYLVLVNFTDQGVRGVKEIPNRQDKSRETAKKFGVERKQVWMTFGPYDFVHLYEAPNDEAMAKFVMTLGSFGNIRTTVMRAWDESSTSRSYETCLEDRGCLGGLFRHSHHRLRCPLLALSGHRLVRCTCLLLDPKRTGTSHRPMSASGIRSAQISER